MPRQPPPPSRAQEIHFLCRADIKPAFAADAGVKTWNETFESKVVLDEPPADVAVDVKIQAAQAADDLIWDGYYVMVMPHDAVGWSTRKLLQPFDPFIEATTIKNADKILPAIIPSIKASCTYEGKIVGMPGNVGSVGLAWQWDALEPIGLKDQPFSWDEVYNAAVEIKKAKPKLVLWVCLLSALRSVDDDLECPGEPHRFHQHPDIRGEASIKALTWLRNTVEEKLMYSERQCRSGAVA